jgi:hypothetical protein
MQEDKYYSRHLAQRYSPETAKSELVEVTESPTEVAEPISQLEINDLLPCFDDIISALREAQIEADRIFGSTSDPPEIPKVFIISVGDGADLTLLQKVIRATKDFGLDGIARAMQNLSTNRIYVGSYGYKAAPYIRLTPGIVEQLLSSNLDRNRLSKILRGSPETLVQPNAKS